MSRSQFTSLSIPTASLDLVSEKGSVFLCTYDAPIFVSSTRFDTAKVEKTMFGSSAGTRIKGRAHSSSSIALREITKNNVSYARHDLDRKIVAMLPATHRRQISRCTAVSHSRRSLKHQEWCKLGSKRTCPGTTAPLLVSPSKL